MWKRATSATLAAMALCGIAHADDDAWAARAQAGYSQTGGTTDTRSANALLRVAYVVEEWKFLYALDGLYGATRGETTAQAWDTRFQANYNFTDRLYTYGALSYTDDRFSGFDYQALVSSGLGYHFIRTDATKLSAQVGVGVRRLKPEILMEDAVGGIIGTTPLPPTSDAVVDAAVNYEHSFNAATKLIAVSAVHWGRDNTQSTLSLQLQVKMVDGLSLAAGYQLVRNSQPPAGVGSSSTLATLNLVYEHKNKNLAPD